VEPTEDQAKALNEIYQWFSDPTERVFKLGGLAGTGKSSMIPWIHEHLGLELHEVQFVAPTNKAALVVQGRLDKAGLKVNARTVHKAYYTKYERHCSDCPLTESLKFVCHGVSGTNACGCILDFEAKMSQDEGIRLVICDESSMIGREVYEDLMASCKPHVKVLFVGDHGQLEAVEDNVKMEKALGKFDLMRYPNFILEQIQRQAAGSPIIQLAHIVRKGHPVEFGDFGQGVRKVKLSDELDFDSHNRDLIAITYFAHVDKTNQFHKGRLGVNELNRIWRANLGIQSPQPIVGERIVAREYMRRVGVSKGTLATITELEIVNQDMYRVTALIDDGREYEGLISAKQFYNNKAIWGLHHLEKWDFGYSLTCHTAQGSEFDSVVVFEPSAGFQKWLGRVSYSRWLYTAITRAKRNLLLVG
jgi:exodeoxyribonuclease V